MATRRTEVKRKPCVPAPVPSFAEQGRMPFVRDDGGRLAAGFRGTAGDCVCRAISIASMRPYSEVYESLARGTGAQRATSRTGRRAASARNGINTNRLWFRDYMRSIGAIWFPTMHVGVGCKVHLCEGELPMGRLVVGVSKHFTAVIDGVIRDTFDPTRVTALHVGETVRYAHRCVYGYWVFRNEA